MNPKFLTGLVGNGLLLAGIAILSLTAGFFAYGQYEQATLATQAAASNPPNSPTTTPIPHPTPMAVSASTHVDVPTPAPSPTLPTTSPSSILRISAASIGLDAKVAESPIVDGQWIIPKFEAGHLQGSAQPGSGGNVVLAGHVQSITSGDVFANIDQLKPGDTIEVYTRDATVTYVVQRVSQVSNDDLAVLKSGRRETLTLITCSGTWLPLQHDYSQRTVVTASRT